MTKLGKRQRSFNEPKYEINIESKDRVTIRQEKINPLWRLLKQILVISAIAYAVMLGCGFVYNLTSHLLTPSRVTILPVHSIHLEPLPAQAAEGINVYIDGRKKPLAKKLTAEGITIPFRWRGQHILGIEHVNSRMDSLAFAREKSRLDSLKLHKHKQDAQDLLHDFIFHKIISERDFDTSRFLYFVHRKPFAEKAQLIFLSKADDSTILFGQTLTKNIADHSVLVRDFHRSLYSRVSVYSSNVDQVMNGFLDDLKRSYAVDIPLFNELAWFSENRMKRFHYADEMRQLFRSSVFILPFIEKNARGEIVAKFVLSFADVGAIEFEPIEINNIALNEIDILPPDAALFEIIAVYLRVYYAFLSSGRVDESHLRDFIAVCSRHSPNVDALDRIGNRIMRLSSAPTKTRLVRMADFFARIEHLQCRALYDELAAFWQSGPLDLGSVDQSTAQEKEVVRAIIKWTLALKENKHQCAENDWPTAGQRLALFHQVKKSVDETATLSWLRQEPLYAVLQTEIANLEQNF
ncbi:hypothetical protein JW998_10805 [candidate division KSB1 bacterium]|nr:hypothetical protein [candidate division KSB1 bacterium]